MRKMFWAFFLTLVFTAGTGEIVRAYSPGQRWTAGRLLELSDALAFGIVEGAEVGEIQGRPFTEYRFAVREVHLDRRNLLTGGQEIRVCVPGGAYTDEKGRKRKWRPLNAPELENGREYVLFLKWQQGLDCYMTVGGEAGVFMVDEVGCVLDHDGNAILDVQEEGFVATPGKEKRAAHERKRPGAPPEGIVEDLSGAGRRVEAKSGSAFDEEYDEARVLKKNAFIRKVLGGRP